MHLGEYHSISSSKNTMYCCSRFEIRHGKAYQVLEKMAQSIQFFKAPSTFIDDNLQLFMLQW